jgi:cyclic beta-1,2-glucan synthetase
VLTIRHLLPYGLRSVSLIRSITNLMRQLESQPADLFAWEAVLTEVNGLAAKVHDSVRRSCERHTGGRDEDKWNELAYWNDRLADRVERALGELHRLAPWLTGECASELRVNCCNPSFAALMAEMSPVTVLTGLPRQYERVHDRLIERLTSSEPLYPALRRALERLLERLSETESGARELIARLEGICSDAFRYFEDMDFAFLLEKNRKMLRIGMDVVAGTPDEACYDLLASEARTAVFIAIAKGQIPRESWFRLGRKITAYRNHRTLVSWSGTMFEYLMPLLHMRSHGNTLLDRAVRGAVKVQQVYARERKIPWGISESAHSDRDGLMQYQYRAFGIGAICARSDQAHSTVVAPYASMLALLVAPAEATANLQRMAAHGCVDRYGFFESADYSSRGKGPGKLIRCFMAHHQGMGLLAIDNALFDGRMQERFHADPLVQATEFLLEERMPALVDVVPVGENLAAA